MQAPLDLEVHAMHLLVLLDFLYNPLLTPLLSDENWVEHESFQEGIPCPETWNRFWIRLNPNWASNMSQLLAPYYPWRRRGEICTRRASDLIVTTRALFSCFRLHGRIFWPYRLSICPSAKNIPAYNHLDKWRRLPERKKIIISRRQWQELAGFPSRYKVSLDLCMAANVLLVANSNTWFPRIPSAAGQISDILYLGSTSSNCQAEASSIPA